MLSSELILIKSFILLVLLSKFYLVTEKVFTESETKKY